MKLKPGDRIRVSKADAGSYAAAAAVDVEFNGNGFLGCPRLVDGRTFYGLKTMLSMLESLTDGASYCRDNADCMFEQLVATNSIDLSGVE